MSTVVDLHQSVYRHRGVFLGRGKAGVPEKLLDLPQVSAHLEKMRRVTVSKAMRVYTV